MDPAQPWYVTLFEHDYHAYFASGGGRSPVDAETFARQTEAEAGFVAQALGLPQGAAILDLCCGWGRHTLVLARQGYRMTGLDISALHIELAAKASQEAGLAIDWIEGDMREVPRPDAGFDGVINLFTAFGYFDDAGNQRVLDEVARVLRPGGRFFTDVMSRDFLMANFAERGWSDEPSGGVTLERRWWEARTGRIHAEWQYIDADGTRSVHQHDVRAYTLQELELRLELAGMRVLDAFGDFAGTPHSRETRRLIVLAERL